MVSSLMERLAMQAVDNWSNFEAYKLQRPVGLIRTDLHRSPFRDSLEEVSRVSWPFTPTGNIMALELCCTFTSSQLAS